MTNRVICVLGAPCSGTSCVAGILHHLGVDMGEGHWIESGRPYQTFEDRRCSNYRAEPTEAQRFIMGEGRDFRAYLEMRLENATGPVGVKIGPAYWLGDPDPASLPVTIVKVDRPLEDSIRSDWRYQVCETGAMRWPVEPYEVEPPPRPADYDQRILRAAQMAGYWQAKERLCEMIKPAVVVDFHELLRNPSDGVYAIGRVIGHKAGPAAVYDAIDSVNPELRNV